ncbi:DUF2975 domain-containing protein [Agromyces protaetiae]|nr:DUF2975 domain-containing protein [Agromyces protaetiae]
MTPDARPAAIAHAALVALLVGAILLQFWIVPSLAAESAARYPEVAWLATPYVVAVGIGLGFFELSLFAVWRAISTGGREGRAVKRAERWLDLATLAIISMAVVFSGVFVHAGSVAKVGGPPMLFGLLCMIAVIVAALVGHHRRRRRLAYCEPPSSARPEGLEPPTF